MNTKRNYKYQNVRDYLIKNIDEGIYDNKKLESENELSKRFGVSRMTVRQALISLQSDGYIYTIPKKGSFVSNKKNFKELDGLRSFSEDVAQLGKQSTTKVLYLEKVKAKENNNITSLDIWKFARIRYLDGIPLAYEVGSLNTDVINGITCKELETSLYHYLEKTLALHIEYAKQDILAVVDEEISRFLELDIENQPLLKVSQTTYLQNGTCIEECDTFYRYDIYSFHQNAYRS